MSKKSHKRKRLHYFFLLACMGLGVGFSPSVGASNYSSGQDNSPMSEQKTDQTASMRKAIADGCEISNGQITFLGVIVGRKSPLLISQKTVRSGKDDWLSQDEVKMIEQIVGGNDMRGNIEQVWNRLQEIWDEVYKQVDVELAKDSNALLNDMIECCQEFALNLAKINVTAATNMKKQMQMDANNNAVMEAREIYHETTKIFERTPIDLIMWWDRKNAKVSERYNEEANDFVTATWTMLGMAMKESLEIERKIQGRKDEESEGIKMFVDRINDPNIMKKHIDDREEAKRYLNKNIKFLEQYSKLMDRAGVVDKRLSCFKSALERLEKPERTCKPGEFSVSELEEKETLEERLGYLIQRGMERAAVAFQFTPIHRGNVPLTRAPAWVPSGGGGQESRVNQSGKRKGKRKERKKMAKKMRVKKTRAKRRKSSKKKS